MGDRRHDYISEEVRIQEAYMKRMGDVRYSWFCPDYMFHQQTKEQQMLDLLKRHDFASLESKHILEIGCGNGLWLHKFINWGAQPQNIIGVDLLFDRVAEARRSFPETLRIECANAAKLEFPDATFDLVLQSTVFTSVLDPHMKRQMAAEMLRVVKGDGFIIWYDFHVDNPRNPDVRGIKKQEIFHLFPNCRIELRRISLAPPLVRLIAPYSLLTCYLLERLKIFNTHYIGVIRKL